MISEFIRVLEVGLSLWLSKDKTKYLDEFIKLKKEYWNEANKPMETRSDAVLDDIQFRLCILGTAFAAAASQPNASP